MRHSAPPLSIAIQKLRLQRDFPDGRLTSNHSGLSWRGTVRPDEYSRNYDIELIYKKSESPKVFVRSPNLTELSSGRPLPHVYDQKSQHLCLYLPSCGFWTPSKPLSTTVMLWAYLWLRHFEVWLVTDVFHGRGEHPLPRRRRHHQIGYETHA